MKFIIKIKHFRRVFFQVERYQREHGKPPPDYMDKFIQARRLDYEEFLIDNSLSRENYPYQKYLQLCINETNEYFENKPQEIVEI